MPPLEQAARQGNEPGFTPGEVRPKAAQDARLRRNLQGHEAETTSGEVVTKAVPNAAQDAPGPAASGTAHGEQRPNLKEKNEMSDKKSATRPLPQRLYIGPSRPFGLPLMRFAILRGEPARVMPQLAERLEAHPEMARLFVSIEALPEARRQVAETGSVLNQAFENVKKASDALAAKQGR
jgi:hypothetical protein